VSLLVTGAIIGGGLLLGRLIAIAVRGGRSTKQREGESDEQEPAEPDVSAPKKDDGKSAPRARVDRFALLPFKIGDVILRAGGEEAWLAGALVFSEDAVAAALFVAPEAKLDRAIFARTKKASARIAWLEPLPDGAITTGAEPPSSIEHEGTRFDRVRRLPVRVERAGTGAPDVGERAIVAEYATPAGDALVLVLSSSNVRAWRGTLLEEGMYDVLPGGRGEADVDE
jgi:hypothetical protein